jgi:CheY-like chemotaxis protein
VETPFQEPGTSPPEGGREQISAYFEALRAHQVPLVVETEDGVEMEGSIQSLDTAKGRLVLSIQKAPTAGMEPDDPVDLFFTVAGNRWVGRARIHYHSDRKDRYSLVLPERLEPADRRRELRAMLDPMENIRGELILADEPEIQILGRLSNISENGFRFSVEGAQVVDSGWEVETEDLNLKQGQALEQVRILGLRELPLDCQGRILDVTPGPFGAILGLRFKFLKPPDRAFLKSYVQNHAFTPPEMLPPLQRIPFAEEILEEINAATDAVQELPGEAPAPAPETPASPLRPRSLLAAAHREPESPRAAEASPEPAYEATPSLDASVQMRLKRFRSIILVMAPGPERQDVLQFLAAQGFTRVVPGGTVGELAKANKNGSVDLALVDWQDPAVSSLDIADFLLHYPFKNLPKVVLACNHITNALAADAHAKGVVHLLVKPYKLDGAFVELLLKIQGEE